MKTKFLHIAIILVIFQGISFSKSKASFETIEPAASEIRVYPNPVSGIYFSLDYHLQQASNIRVELYNMIGKNIGVLIQDNRPAGRNSESLVLPNGLSAGTYLIRIESQEGISTQRLIIRSNNP